MACKFDATINPTCDENQTPGGAGNVAYIFNIEDEPVYTEAGGFVTAISGGTYFGLYKVTTRKSGLGGGAPAQMGGAGGNTFYDHNVMFKILSGTPTTDDAIEKLVSANAVGVILEQDGHFKIYGHTRGLSFEGEDSQDSGLEASSDKTHNIRLRGGEASLPKRFFSTDLATSRAALEALVA